MRWKYFIPGLIVITALVVINIFFLDFWLKKGLIAGGELAFGAKVEVASVKTKISKLGISIQGLAIANRDNPMTNLCEIGGMQFSVAPLPLLSRKVIINEMSVEGVRWGTARTTSGALPPRKQKRIDRANGASQDSMAAKLTNKLKNYGQEQIAALPALQDIQNAKQNLQNFSLDKVLKPNELKTFQQFETAKNEYQRKPGEYTQKINSLNVNGKIQSLQQSIEQVRQIQINSPQDALAAKDKLENARRQMQEAQSAVDNLKAMKNQVQSDFGNAQDLTKRIEEWKNQDLAMLASKLKLPSFSAQGLTRSLLGPMWAGRIAKAIELINRLRQYMPAPKPKVKAQKEIRPRLRGMDIRFPLQHVLPDFLLKKALVSGSTGGPGKKGDPLDFHGVLTDITSDPAILGKPTRVELAGSQGGRSLKVQAILDHTREIPKDTFQFSLSGLNASSLELPASPYLPSFQQGRIAMAGHITLAGEVLDSSLNADLNGLGEPTVQAGQGGPEVQQLLKNLWKGIGTVQVKAACSGTADQLNFSFGSNLDTLLSQRLQGLLGDQVAQAQRRLRAEVDRLLADKQKELLGQFQNSKNSSLAGIGLSEKQLTDKLSEVQKLIQQKENAGRDIAEQQKKQAEEQLKNKAQDQLKSLFGR